MTIQNTDLDWVARQVIAANERFYRAFQEGDFDALCRTWEHSERTTCVHPGQPMLRGWDPIAESWWLRTRKGNLNEVVVTNASVVVNPDVAWVLVDEDLVFRDEAYTVTATNIFARHDTRWLMVSHHASLIERV